MTVPTWLAAHQAPSGAFPVVASLFKDGHYFANDAEVTVSNIWEDGESFGTFNVANVSAGIGFVGVASESAPDMVDSAAVPLLTGMTVVGQLTNAVETGNKILVSLFNLPDWDFEFIGEVGRSESYADDLSGNVAFAGGANMGVHKFAITLTPTSLAISVDGGPVGVATPISDAVFHKVRLWVRPYTTLEWVVHYLPQPDSDLSTLSAIA